MRLALSFRLIAPYATWMALMMIFGSGAGAYALRTFATLAVGAACFFSGPREKAANLPRSILFGLVAGVLVWIVWVVPENFEVYRKLFIAGHADSESAQSLAASPWPLLAIRLIGSAFVISVAEELFFRAWLYDWLAPARSGENAPRRFDLQAFCLMVALFAIEHNRWLVGAIAGAVYGIVAIKVSLLAAIVAHSITNLVLGLEVIFFNHWNFW